MEGHFALSPRLLENTGSFWRKTAGFHSPCALLLSGGSRFERRPLFWWHKSCVGWRWKVSELRPVGRAKCRLCLSVGITISLCHVANHVQSGPPCYTLGLTCAKGSEQKCTWALVRRQGNGLPTCREHICAPGSAWSVLQSKGPEAETALGNVRLLTLWLQETINCRIRNAYVENSNLYSVPLRNYHLKYFYIYIQFQ